MNDQTKTNSGFEFIFIFVAAIIGLLLFAMNLDYSPAPRTQKQIDRDVVNECLRQLDDRLRPPDEKTALMVMCRGIRDKYVKTYGSQP